MTVATKLRLGGFAPNRLAGLALWLDAGRITGLSDGAAVATWPDASTLARDATQATSGNRPVYKTAIRNGRPVVRFTAASTHYLGCSAVAGVFDGADAAFSIVVVLAPVDVATYDTFLGPGNSGTGTPLYEFRGTPDPSLNALKRDDAGDVANANSTAGAWDAAWHVATFTSPGSTVSVWRDGTNVINGAGYGVAFGVDAVTLDQVGIGAALQGAGVNNPFGGDMAELIIYDRALAVGERQQLERHLGVKYSIGVA